MRLGYRTMTEQTAKTVSEILYRQIHQARRTEHLHEIASDLAKSKTWTDRRAFIFFFQHAVTLFPKSIFVPYFWKAYIDLAKDKISQVRILFCQSIPFVKPYIMNDLDRHHELIEILHSLQDSMDRELVEVAEKIDQELITIKPISNLEELEKKKMRFEEELVIR